MLEKELQFERELFFFLNGSDSTLLDNFFYIYTGVWTWLVLYLCYLWIFVYKKNWKEIICILVAVALLIFLADRISSGFFKPFFQRFRPTHHPDFMDQVDIVFNYRGGPYGFISSHAANSFAFATFTALIFKNKLYTFTILLFAILNAYSRIYIGVHFISDIIVGAAVGILVAGCIYLIYNTIRQKWILEEGYQLKKSIYSSKEIYLLCGVFYLNLLIILLFNNQLITFILHN